MKDCCKNHSGKVKKKYATYEEAEAVAVARREKGAEVSIYKCFDQDGFHLTSHSRGDGTEAEKQQLVRKYSKAKGRNVHQYLNGRL